MKPEKNHTTTLTSVDQRWLIVLFWIIAVARLGEAVVTRRGHGMTANWFSLSFYFFIPAALWTLSFSGLKKIHERIQQFLPALYAWTVHFVISIIFAVAMRLAALSIDFYFQHSFGSMTGTFENFIYSIRFLFASSVIENIVFYWIVVILLQLTSPAKKRLDTATPSTGFLQIKGVEGTDSVDYNQIISVEAFGNYLKIHLGETSLCIRGTIKTIEQQLPAGRFFRVHRSFIVNLDAVESIKPLRTGIYVIVTRNQIDIPTGKKFGKAVLEIQRALAV